VRLPALITGETGTGKDLVARAVHGESPRRSGPFVSVSAAALPEGLFEAEVFGHVKGAFSGAERDSPGLLAGARGGTFFLDEVGDMPLALQAKVLRFLDTGRFRSVGGTEEAECDARCLFATNRDLRALAKEGKFRPDLLFRISALEIPVPPLRERIEDVPVLAGRFLERAVGPGGHPPVLEAGAWRALAAHAWPGNVRELENLILRLAVGAVERMTPEDVKALLGESKEAPLFPSALLRSRSLDELHILLERSYILRLHADHGGDMKAVARSLGIRIRALYKRLARLGIRPAEITRDGT
jgi:DNA-binding NtrC family response regulator